MFVVYYANVNCAKNELKSKSIQTFTFINVIKRLGKKENVFHTRKFLQANKPPPITPRNYV